MTEDNNDQVSNSSKNQKFPITIFLLMAMIFPLLKLGSNPPTIPILGFHGIVKFQNNLRQSSNLEMDYKQQEIEKLLEYLVTQDYWFLTTQDLYDFFLTKSKEIPYEHRNKKMIMLTFDDGYKTIYTNLLPILSKLEKKYGKKIKVVLFISPSTLANNDGIPATHLRCQELRKGWQKGFFDIQSHGNNHQNLTKISQPEVISELLLARIKLRKCLDDLDPEQKVASHIAYPYGAYNKQVEKYVTKYYLSGYLYNDKLLNYTCLKDNYKIPRLMVNRTKSSQELIGIIQSFSTDPQESLKKDICK
ncbi:polysaccharide deacetylase family protein [Anabaena cylindrica FACHB-243]|uniref:Polysaccharide deacetylase n=1 Tax=Anabaena cylindrica (strain ATCC 27899 / PCC 7122) TaxID=272123 RepID=K9ZNP2_ANACC|nr:MULTISPECIES: polysaccharide deacetylase family protein [Anabaena]AFZ60409.1 polysaccharide deacetylase [Anabaena cylindrica PCC 7122]MBD2416397.1 polysaccharide deacetylase family protein [Anabaena cylindrica FACHB-243]MBY5284780.1 polysaccharide deacetylase family protein [Anabaena sp. CCAP 1446/1C]MBY5308250.1 polysaccharide deacetylase family protein [Anabaena sp. CCAP 1446/1C]MCM2408450.1 polysaccharide deacetylase family protein [Anabaena sp. CCAP 1446/1C]